MSGPPSFVRCDRCDQVITRGPIFINKGWHCRHCSQAIIHTHFGVKEE